MTQFYASRYTTGPEGEWVPRAGLVASENGRAWGSIDFRPDSTVEAGWSVVAVDLANNPARLPAGVHHLGDTLAEAAQSVKDALANRFGISALADEVDTRRVIRRLLLHEGREDRTRWRPLRSSWGRNPDGTMARWREYRIHLLGVIDHVPVVQGGATISDDFSGGLAGWTTVDGVWDSPSNDVRLTGTGAGTYPAALRYTAGTLATDDHYAQVLQTVGGSEFIGPAVRFSPSAETFYLGVNRTSGAVQHAIQKDVAGSNTTLVSSGTGTVSPVTVRLDVDGSNLELFVGGSSSLTATDTDITGHTNVGLGGLVPGASPRGDDFEAGDLAVARALAASGSFPTTGEIAIPS